MKEPLTRTPRRSLTPFDDRLVHAVAALAGVAGALAPGAPTGLALVDAVLQGAVAALVTLAGARARRWAVLVLAAVATSTAVGWTFAPALVALGLALFLSARRSRLRLLGAVAAALAVQVLLRQPDYAFHGASVVVGALAIGSVLVSAHRRTRTRGRRRNLAVAGVVAALAVVATGAFALAVALAAPGLRDGADDARAALAAARRGDTAEAEALLRSSSESFRSAERHTSALWAKPARLVPVVSQHAHAVQVATAQGLAMAEAGSSVARVGDYDDLKYESGRIDLGQVEDLLEPLQRAGDVLGTAQDRFADLDRSWLVGPIDDEVDGLLAEIDRVAGEATVAAQAVEVAPGLLGADGPRTYFLAFVNPAEERGGGGFLGNYGELTAIDGELELTRSGPIADLITAVPQGQRTLDGPADYLARYGQYNPADFLQDVTFSPHFPHTADVIGQLYPQSGGTAIDGVISVDPYALAALLEFTGPIDVPDYPEPLTADNAADILLREQYLTFGDEDNSLRKDLLVDASEITFDRLTSGSLPGPEQLVEVLGPVVAQRRLQLAATDPAEQAFFETMGADGALPATDDGDGGRDVFMVAHQNFGNSKIDAYLEKDVHYRSEVDPDTGEVDATATVTMRNAAPAAGLPRIVIGNNRSVPDGTNLMLLSIYSSLDLTGAQLDGRDLTMVRASEAGLSVYTASVRIPPGATNVLTVDLTGGLDLSSGRYRLDVVPQPMVNDDAVTIDTDVVEGWALDGSGSASGDQGEVVTLDPRLRRR